MRRLFAIVLTIVAIAGAAWLVLRRDSVPFETLEAAYGVRESQFVTLAPGEFVHYTDTGPRDAPVLVLVHGFSSSLHTWEAWRAPLSERYRVITLDLPGHGLTRMPADMQVTIGDMAALVDRLTIRLGVDRFTLVGSSMGGNVAWRYALAHPEKVEGLVLVGSGGWPRGADEGRPLAFVVVDNPVGRVVLKDLDLTMMFESGLKDSFVDQSQVTDEMVERYAMLARAPGHREILLQLLSRDDPDGLASKERLAVIAVPVLVLHGEGDNLVPPAHGRKFAEAIPGARLIAYDGVGHLPQEEIAARSLSDVVSFLAAEVHPAPEREDTPDAQDSGEAIPAPADASVAQP